MLGEGVEERRQGHRKSEGAHAQEQKQDAKAAGFHVRFTFLEWQERQPQSGLPPPRKRPARLSVSHSARALDTPTINPIPTPSIKLSFLCLETR